MKRERGITDDLKWAVAVLSGVLLGCVVFSYWDGLIGSVIGVTLVVIVRVSYRRIKASARPTADS